MRDLFRLANDIQSFCRERGWKFLLHRWLGAAAVGGATPHRGGYGCAVVAGRVTYRDGQPTGVLPGKLVRGMRAY